jgi:hypothetical protein
MPLSVILAIVGISQGRGKMVRHGCGPSAMMQAITNRWETCDASEAAVPRLPKGRGLDAAPPALFDKTRRISE